MRHRAALFTALALSLGSPLLLAEGRITGQTINAVEKELAVSGASLSLYRAADSKLVALALSDASGGYSFEGVPAGSYHIEATASEYRPFVRRDLQVRDERTLRMNFELLPLNLERY